MKKTPPQDAWFWLMLLSATVLGETAGDLISMTLHVGYGVGTLVLAALLATALVAELMTRTEHPALFWTLIILTSTTGTTLSDLITRSLKLGYTLGTLALAALLAAIFGIWRMRTRSLSVERLETPGVTFLYWTAILTSSTLGTAFGDWLSNDAGLGFAGATSVLAVLLLLLVLAAFFTRVSRVLLFWLGIVVTHPIGATMGDLLTKEDGLNLGTVVPSIVLLGIFLLLSLFVSMYRRRQGRQLRGE
ncbi:hypothetical protein [Longimicrobium sp.]|uniref:hypothetical protein n=1 Tax=Longimicrobium sp. TaxID=2029185 RepID=UPI002BF88854|nr:hypothetical protein [Longimicrobium sp.]HSU12633.1 hypothetical protein [Longimicrobium sp.]